MSGNRELHRGPAPERWPEDMTLTTGAAVVTSEGIRLNGLHYTCKETQTSNWFGKARRRRFEVAVAYDRGNCRTIFIQNPLRSHEHFKATLTAADRCFGWLSHDEAIRILRQRAMRQREAEAQLLAARIWLAKHARAQLACADSKPLQLNQGKVS